MKLFFLLACSLLLFIVHADGLAEYTYYLDQDHVMLKFEMDNTELLHYRINMDCTKGTMSDLCAANYVKSHSDLKINGNSIVFELESSSVHNGHIIFNLKSIKSYKNISDLQIQNNCFYELNSKFKNRVRLNFNHYQKSFLLTKDKQIIQLQ